MDDPLVMRHSASHIMAEAVQQVFPGAKFAFGPATEEGWFYDFDLSRAPTEGDLEKIEARMEETIEADVPFIHEQWPREKAREYFAEKGETYKVEHIDDLEDHVMSIYKHGHFVDLCRGPHVASTGKVKLAYKLEYRGTAYWKGQETRRQLHRIYGIAFRDQHELTQYFEAREEAVRRDHMRLGEQLDLFGVYDEVGPGLILWHPKGARIRNIMEDFLREELYNAGYEFVFTPHLARKALWEKSGHLEVFSHLMFPPMQVEGQEYRARPMNCPEAILIYNKRVRSHRDLPLRWAEQGTVYRYERSGEMKGLLRARGFTQDDAHIFCRPDQLEDEVVSAVDLSLHILRSFGFTEHVMSLSTRPDDHVGSPENWDKATDALEKALTRLGADYEVKEGEGAFYGPKIDIHYADALGRMWQLSTIQLDFNIPERFDMKYVAGDGTTQRPVMVHRALMGSLERFFAIMIENYAGAFPVWLCPVQVVLVPITRHQLEYARDVESRLKDAGLRVGIDDREERMQAKIRDAHLLRIPYVLVIGAREMKGGTVSVRLRTEEDLGPRSLDEFVEMARDAVERKATL